MKNSTERRTRISQHARARAGGPRETGKLVDGLIFLVLAAAIFLAGIVQSSVEASAQQGQRGEYSDSVRPDRSSAGDVGDPEEVEAFFDGLIERQLREGHVAGATVAVVKDGKVHFAKGYGYADLEEREPVIADETLLYPGSAGKLFTWTAVMQLAEEGKLDLDADIETYLDFEIPGTYPEPITMADLMTHTAGFEEQPAALFVGDRQDIVPLRGFLVRYMPERVYPPGEFFAYSNYGTALAGYVVERVSGEPYEEYVTGHILEPLGMEHSAAVQPLPEGLGDDLSQGYHYEGGAYEAGGFEWLADAPAAPVRATATDMAKFMLAHLENGAYGDARILREETVLNMQDQHFTHDPRLPGMAYGFLTSRENDRYVIWHNGESPHFTTMLALLPEERTGLFVSYNTPLDPRPTLSAFLDRFYPPEEETPTNQVPGFDERAERWTGTYVATRVAHTNPYKIVGWLDPIRVSAYDRGLLLRTPLGDQRYAEIEPGLLRQVDGERLLKFRVDSEDRVTHALWGPFAYSRAAWYQTLGFQLPLIAACVALFISTLVAFPMAFFVRRWRKTAPAPSSRLARPLAGALAALNLALMAWFLLALLGFGETYVWPAATVSTITRLWLIGLPLTLGVVVFAAWAWKGRLWNAVTRGHYTLVALAGVLFVVLLLNWNLVGF